MVLGCGRLLFRYLLSIDIPLPVLLPVDGALFLDFLLLLLKPVGFCIVVPFVLGLLAQHYLRGQVLILAALPAVASVLGVL